jgi:hypothetical protein
LPGCKVAIQPLLAARQQVDPSNIVGCGCGCGCAGVSIRASWLCWC